MINSKKIPLYCAACVVISLTLTPPSTASADTLICKNYAIVGQAIAPSKPQARAMAKIDWKQKVNGYFGPSWADWANAKNKWRHCQPAHSDWHCYAQATPCKKLGFTQ